MEVAKYRDAVTTSTQSSQIRKRIQRGDVAFMYHVKMLKEPISSIDPTIEYRKAPLEEGEEV